jgi:hypothetical protein
MQEPIHRSFRADGFHLCHGKLYAERSVLSQIHRQPTKIPFKPLF